MTATSQPEAGSEAEPEWDGPRRRRRVLVRHRRLAEDARRTDTPEELPNETAHHKDRVRKGASPGERKPSPPNVNSVVTAAEPKGRAKSPVPEVVSARRVDTEARKELADLQNGRRSFLKKTAIGAGILALGASLGYGGGLAQATGLSGNARTVITDTEIAARVIAGVRIATEFIPDPVPAGTAADPYPGSAIQAALNDGMAVYIPSGTWQLTSTITRAADSVTIIGAGNSTKLLFNGAAPVISAGSRSGWLIANLATDAGGVDVSGATGCRFTEVWVNGALTDNRPVGIGGGSTGGFYGARAEDYITSGDGSPSNPYNASAIQSAINALPPQGGIVFVKRGIWRGTSRIQVTGQYRHVVIRGEGCDLSEYVGDANGNDLSGGTQVQAGFDAFVPTDFFDIGIAPAPGNFNAQPGVKIVVDPTQVPNSGAYPGSSGVVGRWLGGFTIERCKFRKCDPGIWLTGQNLGGSYFWQVWNVKIDHCAVVESKRGVKVDKGDATLNAGFRGRIEHILFHSLTGGRGFDFNIDTSSVIVGGFLMEGVGTASDDYAFFFNTYGDPLAVVYGVDFGDGSNAQKDARIWIGTGGSVLDVLHRKDLDIGGRGYFRVSRYIASDPGNLNVLNGQQVTIEQVPGRTLSIGTVDGASNRSQIRIRSSPGLQSGFLGSTTPSGSPYTYTNQDMRDEMVYVVGGTISDVTRGGQSTAAGRSHFLAPGDSITILYSSAPTINRFAVS